VKFSEQPPSKQWAALKYRGEKFAEAWFKPEAEPFVVIFRIPQGSFHIPGMGKQLTMENLLKTVTIVPEEVESWRLGDVSHSSMDGANPELKNALAPPPPDVTHLEICVRLNPPPEAVAPALSAQVRGEDEATPPYSPQATGEGEATPTLAPQGTEEGESSALDLSAGQWEELKGRWRAILGLEAAMESLRLSMESLLTEMEASFRKTLNIEQKSYALRADIAQWERAKSRIQYALPKMKDYMHRSIWMIGSPERKRLEELYKNHIEPRIPFPRMDDVLKQLEDLRKARQVLSAQGKTVYQESKGISAEVEGALRTLQTNAAAKARKVQGATARRRK
jgi:hypothetical protein